MLANQILDETTKRINGLIFGTRGLLYEAENETDPQKRVAILMSAIDYAKEAVDLCRGQSRGGGHV